MPIICWAGEKDEQNRSKRKELLCRYMFFHIITQGKHRQRLKVFPDKFYAYYFDYLLLTTVICYWIHNIKKMYFVISIT